MGAVLLIRVTAASGGVTVVRMPAGSSVVRLADVADHECRDGFSQPVIRREHPVVAMTMLSRPRHEVGQAVQKINRRELHDAIGPRLRRLSAAVGPDPVGGLNGDPASGQHGADFDCAAVWAASHREPFEGKGWPGAVAQRVFQTPKRSWAHRDLLSVIRTLGYPATKSWCGESFPIGSSIPSPEPLNRRHWAGFMSRRHAMPRNGRLAEGQRGNRLGMIRLPIAGRDILLYSKADTLGGPPPWVRLRQIAQAAERLPGSSPRPVGRGSSEARRA